MGVCGQYSDNVNKNRFFSCSNKLTLDYRSSDVAAAFKLYFEVIDRSDLFCPPSTTRTPATTAQPPATNTTISSN
jgi:hypothetical protein